ncbi:MAG: hypothetical protein EXX96DRAFT_57207 [Benjaminiella poitrasii]|nr:MAG: hypothetical protein EXX96DRAFT_57207 [Benjaminiella poitrasii]
MTILLTIKLGYLDLPFVIKRSVCILTTEEEEDDENNLLKPRWSLSHTTLSLIGFVKTLPLAYSTLENHVLQLAPQSKRFEEETIRLLSDAFNQSSKAKNSHGIHGVLRLPRNLFGILSCTEEPTIFTLQIMDPMTDGIMTRPNYTVTSHDLMPSLDRCVKPMEMVDICQRWPQSQDQLVKLAGHVYQLASLYGYWDYWRIFEGVCTRFQINAEQLVNMSNNNTTTNK